MENLVKVKEQIACNSSFSFSRIWRGFSSPSDSSYTWWDAILRDRKPHPAPLQRRSLFLCPMVCKNALCTIPPAKDTWSTWGVQELSKGIISLGGLTSMPSSLYHLYWSPSGSGWFAKIWHARKQEGTWWAPSASSRAGATNRCLSWSEDHAATCISSMGKRRQW